MKRVYTRVKADGSRETFEEHDEAPAMHKAKNNPQTAAKGHGGDTELAHVNPWEQALLKKLGGSGTRNPHTGLKEFTNPLYGVSDWYQNAFGRQGDQAGLDYWTNYDGANPWDAFLASAGAADKTAYTGWNPSLPLPAAAPATPSGIEFPTDIFPSSTTSSNTYSGLPGNYQNELLKTLMPQLNSSIKNMPGNIDDYTNQALGSYQMALQNALRTNIPTAINSLANRGIINSTEGQRILSGVNSSAAIDASTKGYQTAMEAAKLKAAIPSMLAQIGELGKSSSTTSQNYQSDPTAMYQIIASMLNAQA
jgi:hypothetical protein